LLGTLIGVDACNICLTGSSCVGISLNPRKGLATFHDHSDIDVAIVSDYYFDVSWRHLRTIRLGDAIDGAEREALKSHQTRYVYWGTIATDRILRVLPFAGEWTIAMSKMQAETPTEGRDINFRIYKDYDALRSYQQRGVEQLKTELLER
jgi:hypothetical protein